VSGLLQVQQQISADESTLNSLLAQQRALDHETTYATVTMTLVSPPSHAIVHKKTTRHGFVGGLAAGWRALKHATAAVLTAFGAALPFLIVVFVLGGIGYLIWRRFLRRGAAPAKPGPAAAGPTESG
jgi:threonine/homoserine/homoserine lactone efflux protein